jgi:hypothetical protein
VVAVAEAYAPAAHFSHVTASAAALENMPTAQLVQLAAPPEE